MDANSNTTELNLTLPLRSQGASYVPKGFSQHLAQRRRSRRPPPLDLSWTASLTRSLPYIVVPAHVSRSPKSTEYWTPKSGSTDRRVEEWLGVLGPTPPIPPRAAARTSRPHNVQKYEDRCGWKKETWREELMFMFATWAILGSMFMVTWTMLRLTCLLLEQIPIAPPKTL